jgi:hypothetical protein
MQLLVNLGAAMNGLTSAENLESIEKKPTTQLSPKDIQTANYIADMLLELRKMAKTAHLSTLMVLLEVSFYEAFSIANRIEIPPEEIVKLYEMERAGQQSQGL